jgi:hypothetical protein
MLAPPRYLRPARRDVDMPRHCPAFDDELWNITNYFTFVPVACGCTQVCERSLAGVHWQIDRRFEDVVENNEIA